MGLKTVGLNLPNHKTENNWVKLLLPWGWRQYGLTSLYPWDWRQYRTKPPYLWKWRRQGLSSRSKGLWIKVDWSLPMEVRKTSWLIPLQFSHYQQQKKRDLAKIGCISCLVNRDLILFDQRNRRGGGKGMGVLKPETTNTTTYLYGSERLLALPVAGFRKAGTRGC